MADSDKDIIITPNRGLSGQPEIYFGGSGGVPIRMKVLDDSYGTLSWEGSAGQLFSINNNLTSGSIFSVNDVSGIPSIEVNADGTVTLAPYGGNVGIGVTAPNTLLHVGGTASASGFSGPLLGNATTATTLATSRNFSLTGDVTASAVSFNGSGNVQLTTAIAAGSVVNADISASAAIATSKLAANTISGVALGSNLNSLTIGSGLGGSSYNGSSAVTITNNGVTSFNGLTGAVGGVCAAQANTFTALQTFTTGISAAGATLSGTLSATSVVATNGFQVGSGAINAKTAGYTLTASDNGKIITINSASAVTLTVGTAVGTAGFSCTVIQLGAGQVTIAASGTTLNSASGLKLAAQHAAASIVCYTTNTFNVAGNLTT